MSAYVWLAVAAVFLGPVIAAATGALVHAVRVAAGDVGCTPAPGEDAPAAAEHRCARACTRRRDDGSMPPVVEASADDLLLNADIERFNRGAPPA